jgi:hypothetical protein
VMAPIGGRVLTRNVRRCAGDVQRRSSACRAIHHR